MDPLAILYILIGTLILFSRGPMIFAPRATMALYDRLVASDTRVRGIGLLMAFLAVAIALIARGEAPGAGILQAFGWLFAAAAAWLLAAPGSYRRLARALLGVLDDPAIVRVIGLVAVSIGVALIYVGLYVV